MDSVSIILIAFLAGAGLLTLLLALPYLLRTRRKMREYQILTQVGQAVSARLDHDEILRTVHRELGRICQTRSFYIAFRHGGNVHFDLEVRDGNVLPKRVRAIGRGLTEYILQRRAPLLVRSNVVEKRNELGLEPNRDPTKSFCAVPIFIAGQAIGVMAAISRERENAYDERDIELMRTTASQLAIALENARRLHDEHSRAEYLSFLNNVSKAAISSKKPVDLLNQVVKEVERSFAFDHVNIGLVDYDQKEVEVRAEGGRDDCRIGLGTRVPLESGVLGIAAQRNELRKSSLESTSPGEQAHAVLCHPITYGETLLGILTVECFNRDTFMEEEILTLGTLADLLATALHNAMTFEEMEYQSITDCLTGIKTRRYFLESVHAEWSRASRSGRAFSLLLIDLDKFKTVNDTLGHLEGDLVLARVGRILEHKCRHSNVVARYGGDEFIVLMPETSIEHARVLGERLRSWLANDALLNKRGVTGSFGVASFPLHGATIEEIIRQADQAMYLSKTAGGNRVSMPASVGKSTRQPQEYPEQVTGNR
jgi:diguanylate cyclase (GGDEF)-like protein